MAVAAARNALLKHLRLAAGPPATLHPPPAAIPSGFLLVRRRGFSDEVRGSFLDKGEVADRIVTVVKNFQKVEPSKPLFCLRVYHVESMKHSAANPHVVVTPNAHFQKDLGLDSLDTVEIVMALEEEFGFEIPDNEADKIESIKEAVDFIASHPQAK